jgi:hypothetical protein
MTLQPQVISLVGSTATGIAIDSTGNNYDGLSQLSWPFPTPNAYDSAKLVVAGDATATDATIDFSLRDYNAGSNVVSIEDTDGDDSQLQATFDPDLIDGTANVGLRVNVTSASGTGGATADFDARVVLIP